MTSHFRAPTSEMPTWVRLRHDLRHLVLLGDYSAEEMLDVRDAEALLEVLLDICPNAEALAHNWLLEVQKAEYMKGGK
jgi:hypothetical protein